MQQEDIAGPACCFDGVVGVKGECLSLFLYFIAIVPHANEPLMMITAVCKRMQGMLHAVNDTQRLQIIIIIIITLSGS